MKIAIMSDSHDRWDNMSMAITHANAQGCELLLHAGDLVAPPGIKILQEFNGQIKFVWGNNEAEKMGITRQMDALPQFEFCGDIYEGTIDAHRIFMNHYPWISELAANSGQFDLSIYGHTHLYHNSQIGNTILLNPGEIQGYKTGEPSFVIYDTKTKHVTKINL